MLFSSLASYHRVKKKKKKKKKKEMSSYEEESIKGIHLTCHPEEDDDDDVELEAGRRMSRLSVESYDGGDDADAEEEEDKKPKRVPAAHCTAATSLPGTPDRLQLRQLAGWDKEYASESELARGGGARRKKRGWGRRLAREGWAERAWEKRRGDKGEQRDECRLLVRPMGPDSGRICMDMMEVKACRDLGLELPCDWTVEVPGGVSGVETSSGSNSPIANWRISSPGDDPKEVKARLKVWAQAVALASAADSN